MAKNIKRDWGLFYEQQHQARFINRTDEWTDFYNQSDVFTKSHILEHRANHSYNAEELRNVFNRVVKRMPQESRIVYALSKNPYSPEDIQVQSEARHNQIWANTPAAIAWQSSFKDISL